MTTISVTPGDNLQGAANSLRPGDTLLLKAGTHYGRATIPVDGVSITGESGAIVEGTDPLNEDWTLATDSDVGGSLAGSGTWRVPNPGQIWMLIDDQGNTVFRIDARYVNELQTSGYYYMSAYQALAVPNNARPGQDYGADWWNGIEAMSVYNKNNGHIYVRYRDGRRPGRMRWSGGYNHHQDVASEAGSVFYIYGRKGIRFYGLSVRGGVRGIALWDCEDIVVEESRFKSFDFGIETYGFCTNIKILHNEFDCGLVGTNKVPPICKTSSENPYPDARLTASHVYMMGKFWHDNSDSTHLCGLKIRNGWIDSTQTLAVPHNIEFGYNHSFNQQYAVDMMGGDGINIHHNDVHNMIDMAFQRQPGGGRNVQIHDNRAREAGYCLFRWHMSQEEAGDNYIYNNRVSDIDQVSDFVFHAGPWDAAFGKKNWLLNLLWKIWRFLRDILNVICFGRLKAVHSYLRVWHYHNSFSGGNSVWHIYGLLTMPGAFFVNNLLSNNGNTANSAGPWPSEVGGFDYNSMSGALGAWGAWYGGHNVTGMPAIWPCNQVEKDFVLPAGHPAKETGIDVSRPFVINGKTYGSLPGFELGYYSGQAPDRGWIDRGEDGGEIVVATLTAAPDSVAPGANVEISWTGSGSARDWYALYKIGEQHAFDKYAWGYTSSCAGSPTTAKPSGTCVVTMPAELGSYEFHLYANDGTTVIATSNQVTVSEAVPEPEPEPPPEEDLILAFVPVWIERPENVIPVQDPEVLKRLMRGKKPKS